MTKGSFVKCITLFLFSTCFLYAIGETYQVSWLQFQVESITSEEGFSISFSSLIPVIAGVLIVGVYEIISKWHIKRYHL